MSREENLRDSYLKVIRSVNEAYEPCQCGLGIAPGHEVFGMLRAIGRPKDLPSFLYYLAAARSVSDAMAGCRHHQPILRKPLDALKPLYFPDKFPDRVYLLTVAHFLPQLSVSVEEMVNAKIKGEQPPDDHGIHYLASLPYETSLILSQNGKMMGVTDPLDLDEEEEDEELRELQQMCEQFEKDIEQDLKELKQRSDSYLADAMAPTGEIFDSYTWMEIERCPLCFHMYEYEGPHPLDHCMPGQSCANCAKQIERRFAELNKIKEERVIIPIFEAAQNVPKGKLVEMELPPEVSEVIKAIDEYKDNVEEYVQFCKDGTVTVAQLSEDVDKIESYCEKTLDMLGVKRATYTVAQAANKAELRASCISILRHYAEVLAQTYNLYLDLLIAGKRKIDFASHKPVLNMLADLWHIARKYGGGDMIT